MAIDYNKLKNWHFDDVEQTYTEHETMLYALGLGLGADPTDENQLRYVYEKNLGALPTMAVVLGYAGFWMQNPESGINWLKLVHGEQALTLHKPLPAAGTVIGRSRVLSVIDKGAGKGAVIITERKVIDKASGDLLATMVYSTFCRGDGGFGKGDPSPPPPPAVPGGEPEKVCDLPTLPQAALIYRLSGDRNPLHAEPAIAVAAGFPRPILHGLCTYGVAGHALLKTYCDYDAARLTGLSVRFSAPVFPGETIRTEMWRRGDKVQFRARVVERDIVVLNNGVAEIKNK